MLFSKTTGNGINTIIFVHGNSQDRTVWLSVIGNAVLREYTNVVVDLPGHGQSFRSEHPEKDYTLRGMALHLQNFANQYSKPGYVLVGSSLATNYIAERAHGFKNCKGVFLIGPSLIGENIMVDEIVQPNPNFATIFAATATEAELTALMNDEAYIVTDTLRSRLMDMYHNTDPQLRTQLGESIANQDYGDEIGNLWKQNIPIAVVYGAHDKIIYPDYMAKLQLKMWDDQLIKIPKAGHCCQFDEPELIAKLIARFAADCFK